MVVVPLTKSTTDYGAPTRPVEEDAVNWTHVAAAGAIVAGGLLMLTGWRRAGMVAAASGTVLTLLDQQDTIRAWWSVLPEYIDEVQRLLDQVESTVEEIDAKRNNLRQILTRTPVG